MTCPYCILSWRKYYISKKTSYTFIFSSKIIGSTIDLSKLFQSKPAKHSLETIFQLQGQPWGILYSLVISINSSASM
ncbi:hypothetical protein [Aquimarina hainanensis]|uniref:hypothetical protein n=1 Tax=Aquimarina hainanensis TaxID=1578017 RepID=UPI00361C4D42